MKKMNTKMKLLSLALLGLGGFAMAGAASAACPTEASAWSGPFVGGGSSAIAIVTPGADGTECQLSSTLGDSGNARAAVYDDSPANEPHYRAQFIFDPTNLAGTSGNEQALIFRANAAAAHGGSVQTLAVKYLGTGGGGKRLLLVAACENPPLNLCQAPVSLPVQAGPNRIEFDLTVGATSTLRYWVTDLATTTSDTAPTGTLALTGGNAGWVGVDRVYLGMASPSPTYRTLNASQAVLFDQFDSRRQTFIGN